ncbi:MAG TPA: hypothetical protein VMF11_07540 [Candidatus Baltobacteraceae bacterium]|nr:hypothetical protein [Candidatus Baltobacteraceae bacterium]
MDEEDDIRKEVEAADATGMVANQELLASFPAAALRGALPPSHHAHQSIGRLQGELAKPRPSREALEEHVNALRSVRELEATIANWWDSPITQRIVFDLTQIGL